MPEDLGEKTEDATPKRLQDAREEGNVARSTDAAGALLLLGVTLMLLVALTPTLSGLRMYVEKTLGGESTESLVHTDFVRATLVDAFWYGVRIAGPLLILAWLIAYASVFWQIGWLFSAKAIQPSLTKLNPISGFKRVFGVAAVVKATLDSSKVVVVLIVAFVSIAGMLDTIVLLPSLELMPALGRIGWMLFDLALRILAVLLLLGFIDFAWQRHKHKRDLRMSKTEVKEEMKQTEGDPETKRRRRRLQQQLAMQRLTSDVPRADVIVTNPEHMSIAIQYDGDKMHAPKVVAKGADYVALRIRYIAIQHKIPIVERKPLARALYRSVEVGQEIPPQFYQAIAEILAYVYRLAGKAPALAK